jgi:hypothetical protein
MQTFQQYQRQQARRRAHARRVASWANITRDRDRFILLCSWAVIWLVAVPTIAAS